VKIGVTMGSSFANGTRWLDSAMHLALADVF
jgi:hypothetical protein